MIKISENRKISRVVISTALGLSGRGIFPHTLKPKYKSLLKSVEGTGTTVIAKSTTRHPRKGNFILYNPFTWKYIKKLPNCGMLNAYGLTNQGIEKCVKKFKGNDNTNIIPSLYQEFYKGKDLAINDILILALTLRDVGVKIVELNFSCPNSKEAIVKNMDNSLNCVKELKKSFPSFFMIAKISIAHPYEFSQELERAGIDAIHGINTVPFEMVYPNKISPLTKVGGGGVSGKPIFWIAYDYNKELRKKVRIPVIMGGGVMNLDHVIKYEGIGANAVSICTVALRNPAKAKEVVELFNDPNHC